MRRSEIGFLLQRPLLAIAAAAVLLLAPSLVLGTLISQSAPQNLTWAAQFSEQFRAGILYPRWMPDSFDGLGGPAFYFYPPLPFWINALLSVITFDLPSVSYRLAITTALLLCASGLAMNAWLTRETNNRMAALAGAIAYMAAPYHLLDHYVRGAFAEFTAFAVLPLVVLAIRLVADKHRAGVPLLAVTYAALPLSHLPTALLISLTVVPLYVLFRAWTLRQSSSAAAFLLRTAGAGVLGLGLTAIYLIPALTLQDTISIELLWVPGYQVDTWFLLTPQRWLPPFYTIVMITSAAAAYALATVGMAVVLRQARASGERWQEPAFWVLVCLLGLVLMSGLTPWFWHIVPMVAKVQFPWRLMIVVEFAAITALCLMPWATFRRTAFLLFVAAVVAAAPCVGLLGKGIVSAIAYALKGEIALPQDVMEYLPAGYPRPANLSYTELGLEPLANVPEITCTPAVSVCRVKSENFDTIRVEIESATPSKVVLRRFFFPAWRLEPAQPIVPTIPLRLVSFAAEAGHQTYRLKWVTLPEDVIGRAVSCLSLLLLVAWATTGASSRRPAS
jgi:6-pyruvoyl-tetrahydropterin synthase related domain